MASADPLHEVLDQVVEFAANLVECDSCFVYVLEQDELVLRASKNPHEEIVDRLNLHMGQGITGWVAEHREPVAISQGATQDPRFQYFNELPEDTYEAFLSAPVIARNRVVGVVNVQHRVPHQHTGSEMEVLTTVGEQVGCVLVLARMEPTAVAEANHAELVLSSGPVQPRR